MLIIQNLTVNNNCIKAGVEINTGPMARGQWICSRASEIYYPLARLACKLLRLHGVVLI